MPPEPATTPDAGQLRRIALAAQGLQRKTPFGRGKGAVHRTIEHLGYVQIDTISVIERAHHHVLGSRVPNYQPAMLDRLLGERKVFEYWFHAAAFLPMRDFRFALPRMQSFREGKENWMRSRDRKLMREVLDRVRSEGPLRARDFEDTRDRSGTWWDWKPAKRALEQLFMQGDLLISERNGFQKTYDLAERVLPEGTDLSKPSDLEFAGYLVDTTLRAHGCATLKSFSHLRRGREVRNNIRQVLLNKAETGEITVLEQSNGPAWYALSDHLNARTPRVDPLQVHILSPFDNAVIHRDRTQALYDFDYRLECYVPEQSRLYGYFCLPILMGDQFIGRVDAKAHRREQRLELKHLHLENLLSDDQTIALAERLIQFAGFNGCDHITLSRVTPSGNKTQLQSAIRSIE